MQSDQTFRPFPGVASQNAPTQRRITLVDARDLNFFFGSNGLRKQVLSHVNFQVGSGEIVILTGPSGSGKTTLLTLIGGLRTAKEGQLHVLGNDLIGASDSQLMELRRQIGFIFQAHNLHRSLTALENVRMGLEVHGTMSTREMNAAAQQILQRVGLEDRCDHYPHQLSGGQKQRVAVARALIARPKLVLADEPTAALDGKSGRDVVELMSAITSEHGGAVLMVTHDNRILDIADRITRMEDGRVIND
jgi:putative ABC transport system ATP-binding protein